MQVKHIHFPTIDSTNSWAKAHFSEFPDNTITCVSADEQTAGRGRFNRSWKSPKGCNIYASFCFFFDNEHSLLPQFSQVLSVSCLRTLETLGLSKFDASPTVKWPNDIFIKNEKIAGILCEVVHLKDRIGIICGLGLNVNMKRSDLDEVGQQATSLSLVTGQKYDCKELLDGFAEQFLNDLALYELRGFKPFFDYYSDHLAFKGEDIILSTHGKNHRGICHSIMGDGRLNLVTPGGETLSFSSGDVIKVSCPATPPE